MTKGAAVGEQGGESVNSPGGTGVDALRVRHACLVCPTGSDPAAGGSWDDFIKSRTKVPKSSQTTFCRVQMLEGKCSPVLRASSADLLAQCYLFLLKVEATISLHI